MMSQINNIQLKNWKIHKKLNIKFEKGLNFIVGENGSGKTSIIEAILFGLTGRTLHSNRASYRNISVRSPAHVNINFSHEEMDYEITRSFNGTVYHKLKLISDNEILDKYTIITKKMEEIFNSRISFFEHMIYYGEKEYFKSFQSNQKHQFRYYIENFMGIKYLEEFRTKTRESANQLKNDLKEFNKKLENISVKDEINYDKLKTNLRRNETKFKEAMQEKNYFSNKLKKSDKELKDIKRKIDDFDTLKKKISSILKIENLTDLTSIINDIDRKRFEIVSEIKENLSNIEAKRPQVAAFDREERIFKLINKTIGEILRKNKDLDYCPLCKTNFKATQFNLLLKDRSKEIIQDIEKNVQIKDTINEFNKKAIFLENELRELDIMKETIPLNKIYFEDSDTFDKLNHTFESLLKEKNSVENEYKTCLNSYNILHEEILNIKSKIKSIEKIDTDLDKNFIEYKKRKYNHSINLNKIIGESLEKTLHDLRLKFLNPIMSEITHIWNYVFKNQNSEVSFDKSLNPVIKKDFGEIDFKNLSGGEKTILLILSRSLILHNFSKASFLLLDEPLEHLDVENRRLIIKYLEDFCKSGLIDQLIITTFEETLTRRLKRESNVNLVYL